ncbi:Gag-pro-like protein [Cucumis melo var. makuwa]|uniref:Gag-pro-like protein n=1 Tax=Cucumis melo var. makuwa TaxID=1194695 RepID=A0A5A7SM57_CUCMM|nr:Gag-pro-like protein [Cucumis melo var. makuwa]TYK25987.1 Gag-pro-like protein [Cucumis melo var. makuwa]
MGNGKVVVDTTQSSNPVEDTDDPIYPPGFTPCYMNVPQSQTTQHYVATNSLYAVPPLVPGIEHLEAQAKIEDMGQNENTPAKQKLDVLEERLQAIEGTDVYGNIDATQLCFVPSLIILAKFKVLEFDKYDGSSCPRSHLLMYCRKMVTHINNDNAHIHVWKDLADAFLKQYKHNIDMATDHLDLQQMEKKSLESFKEYAQRWRDMGIEVQPLLTDKEMTSMFMNTLRAPFYDRMIELLPQLIQNRQLAPISMIPIQLPYLKWYDSNARCDYHARGAGHSTENYLALKRKVQSLIKTGWLSFKKSGEKPNVNENPLPNHENPKVNTVDDLVEKCKNEVYEIVMPTEALFEGISGITQSGRCYKPDNLTVPSDGLILEQGRKNEKRNVEHCKDQDVKMLIIAKDIEYKKLVMNEDANEFLKIVKQRKALSQSVIRYLEQDDKIPPEGLGHTKALQGLGHTKALQVKCKDYVIARCLVDNGSALNIMPKSTLLKLLVDMSHIKSSTMVVKAFDGHVEK